MLREMLRSLDQPLSDIHTCSFNIISELFVCLFVWLFLMLFLFYFFLDCDRFYFYFSSFYACVHPIDILYGVSSVKMYPLFICIFESTQKMVKKEWGQKMLWIKSYIFLERKRWLFLYISYKTEYPNFSYSQRPIKWTFLRMLRVWRVRLN